MRQLALCVVALLMAERQVSAYTDPGSGALLWQVLAGGAVAFMFYARRFLAWLKRNKRAENQGGE
ncbi:MAG: hypothetical protein LAP39_22110 [Acidobacteriia bacterium]|nr:hypothetical protein [Terriglobia bacterium]